MIANSIAICKSGAIVARSCSHAACMDLVEDVWCSRHSFIYGHDDTCGSCCVGSLHLQFAVGGSLAAVIVLRCIFQPHPPTFAAALVRFEADSRECCRNG